MLNRDEPSRALRVFGFRQPARAFGQVPIVLRRLPSGSPTRGKSEIVRARGTQFGSADRKQVPVDMCLAPGLARSGCVDACDGCSFASMVETRSATIEDAERISALLMANASDRGGALYGDWSIGVVTKWITDGALIIVAMDGPKLAGVLFTSEKAQASALPVVAMLKAWPGGADAYVYGPVCIDQAARGQGVLEALYAHVVARLPDREAILFINASNTRSLQAHGRLGMVQVANFTLGGEVFIVLSTRNANLVRK
jgi:GNAT superfamily N-acetyltransferase